MRGEFNLFASVYKSTVIGSVVSGGGQLDPTELCLVMVYELGADDTFEAGYGSLSWIYSSSS